MRSKQVRIASFAGLGFAMVMALTAPAQAQRGGSLLPSEPQSGIAADALGSPFPMAAAPATRLPSPKAELPASMSGKASDRKLAATTDEYQTGSPFPMAADPAIRQGQGKLQSVDEGADFNRGFPFSDTATPFPTAGAPARRLWW